MRLDRNGLALRRVNLLRAPGVGEVPHRLVADALAVEPALPEQRDHVIGRGDVEHADLVEDAREAADHLGGAASGASNAPGTSTTAATRVSVVNIWYAAGSGGARMENG